MTSVHADMVDSAGGKNVWLVGGGDLVGQFADRGLLDELSVQYGRLPSARARPSSAPVEFALAEVARDGDFTCARYTVAT